MDEYKTGKERTMDTAGDVLGGVLEVATPVLTGILKAIDLKPIIGLVNEFPAIAKLLGLNIDPDAIGLPTLLKNEKLMAAVANLIEENSEPLAKALQCLSRPLFTDVIKGNVDIFSALLGGEVYPDMIDKFTGIAGITNEFSCPHIVHGKGALERSMKFLSGTGRRSLIVTDKDMVKFGHADTVREMLEYIGYEVEIFDEVEPDPSIPTIEKGGEVAREFKPDWLIGLGGGSCLDAAKAVWIKYVHPDIPLGSIDPFSRYNLREKAHYMAIPTTSGTGAESTWAIVLTDPVLGRKWGIACRESIADVAVIDPRFPMSMPKKLTAGSGLDVLAHSFGGYVSKWRNDFSEGLCIHAIRMGIEYLPKAYKNPDDMEAREKMHNAATVAGLGFGNSQATLEHSIGHAVGAVHHLHHGLAVGIALPYTIQFYANAREKETRELYAKLARILGIEFKDEEDAVDKIVGKLRSLMDEIEAPKSYGETGIKEEDWKRGREDIIEFAYYDPCFYVTPRIPSKDELARIVDCCWEGRDVTF
ncbi:MAG: Alcohol dehydrogenase [Candidatus Methanolliviera sp. GoM_oil]|nr:MAG: Alcohol dehydrogenase [Candidatus Methanolliviera sp. GoM_oil]